MEALWHGLLRAPALLMAAEGACSAVYGSGLRWGMPMPQYLVSVLLAYVAVAPYAAGNEPHG